MKLELYKGFVSPEMEQKAKDILKQDYGYQEQITIDDLNLLFKVEEHTWYGLDLSKPSTPHKGVTIYLIVNKVKSYVHAYIIFGVGLIITLIGKAIK